MDVWPSWLAIAKQQRDLARVARDSNPGTQGDPNEFGDAMKAEHRAAMVSMTAAAFTMEAFASSVHHFMPASKVGARSADARIHQTLCRTFRFSNTQSKLFRTTLQQVFRFRDRAVHPPATFAEPVGHPYFRVGMERSSVIFRVENAETSCAFVHQVVWHCLHKPRGSDEFEAWCAGMADEIGEPPTPATRSPNSTALGTRHRALDRPEARPRVSVTERR